MMLLTIIITMVMIRIITAVMIIAKFSLPTIDFATRYSTRYSDFLLQPYSESKKPTHRYLIRASEHQQDRRISRIGTALCITKDSATNIIFVILESCHFQKYSTCWVFKSFCLCLCLCLCLFLEVDTGQWVS